jgi:hypothetical protein
MGYNVAFPAVACTTAIVLLVCLLSYDNGNGVGNVLIAPAAVPDIAIDGLTDICYFDDDDCLSNIDAPPSPSPVARSLISQRALSLDNEMVYLERDPVNPNIKRLYRFQGGCGFQYVRNEIDRYITMWPHLEGGEGITIDDICDPGGAIIISVNTSSFNITSPPSNNIVPSCGVVPTLLNNTTSLALLFVGENGVDVNTSCSPGDPITIAFDPTAVNITEVVLAWFGAQCGLAVSEAAGQISIALDLQGLNGIQVTDGCPGESTVNITFAPSDVNAEEVYDEWFVDGCGITHSISGENIVLAVNATGSNGIVVDPLCGEGDALGLTFDPSAVNMTEAGGLWFVESCGTSVNTSSGQVAISTLIEGGVGITVNTVCAPGDPIVISWDASEVNLTDLVDMVFNGTCGVSVPQDNNTLAITIHIDGENGIVVDDVCAMGEPIVLRWDPYLVNATELVAALFGSSCGFSFTESGGTITGNVLLNGVNGIEVNASCSPGGSIDLVWNESAVDIAAVVTNWFGAQCGVSVTEDGGTISVSANLTGENGIMVDNTCVGGDVILTFNASQVNGSQVYDAWFADGCGITHSTNESTTEISTNIAVSQPLFIDGACGAGDVLVIGLNISALNVSTDIMFGDVCGIMFTDNMGVTEASVLLAGFNGIVVDDACVTDIINIAWDPANVNTSQVLDEWFIPGCGIVMGVSGGDIVISTNITGSSGVGVTSGCVAGDTVELYFDPSTLNVTEFVDVVIGAQCGVSAVANAGFIDLKTELSGENGIAIDETCTGLDVIVSWDPVAVNVSQVLDEWFIAGCGIELTESLGDITVSVNITGYGGVGVASGCGVGDALELYFDPSTMNVSEFVDVVFGVQCGVSYVEDMGAIDLKVELAGENGIIIDETCTGLDVIVSWDPVNVNVSQVLDEWFIEGCGVILEESVGDIVVSANITGSGGVGVASGCGVGDALDIYFDAGTVNVSQVLDEWFVAGCGIELAESMGDITVNVNITGSGGVGVTAGCGVGDTLELYFDSSMMNVSEFVDNVIGAQCGVSAIENAGVINLTAELDGSNGITIDETCAGPDVIISWDPVDVNASQVLDEWFIEGCGITLEDTMGDIIISTNISGSGGIGVTSGCGVGDALALYFNPATMNVSEFADVVFGAQCGVSAMENAGVIDLKTELDGTNGITIDETCTGPDVVISWDPVNVNVSQVLDEWFIEGCGITLEESVGDVVVSANITGSGGINVASGCGVGDALELFFDPSTMNVSEFVDIVFGAQCGVSAVENAGVIDLKAELAGTNGITVDETCAGPDIVVSWDPANVNASQVLDEWFIEGCGITMDNVMGDIVVSTNISGSGGIGVTAGCGVGEALELYFNPNTLNVSEFTDVVFGAQCGVSAIANMGVINLKAELAGTNGITIDETCTGADVIVGFDPTLTNTTGINNAWFRDTCGVSRSISGGDIGFDLDIVGDGIITVDNTCMGTDTSITIGINVSALNIPNLGSACLVYTNASLTPAVEVVRPEGFLFHRIIAEEGCNNRRTHFYIDLPHAPLGFGMLIGVNNVFSGAGVRSSSILGGENNVVAGGSQFTTTLNGQNHAVNIAGNYGLIGGGNGHILNGAMNVALMGATHTLHAQSSHSSVMNGINNVVGPFTGPSIRQFITINNGLNNVVKSAFSSIHNGVGNLIEDGSVTITGGVILTGSACIVRGSYSVILGATGSTNNGQTSLIGVGDLHFISNTAVYGVIGGGERHVVQAASGGVFVGYSCTISTGGTNSWIGGGRFNNVLGLDAFILGGNTNVNNAARSGIGAGRNHNIGVLATDSFILAGDGVVLSLATDSFTAASKHLLAVGALRTSGISTSNGGVWNLAFGSYFYINTNNAATIRLPTTMPEGTKFVIRNESNGATTTQCSTNGCTLCSQGSACALNGSMNIATRTAVSFIFIGNNYYVL